MVQNRTIIDAVCGGMRTRPMFIADGHHRFEVACQYKRFMEAKTWSANKASADQPSAAAAGWNFVMTYFSDITHNPFTIWPTHRLIKKPARVKDALAALAKRGTLEQASGRAAVLKILAKTRRQARDPRYRFGVFAGKKGYYIFTLAPSLARQVKKDPVSRLDVAVLHQMLIEPCFGIKKIEKSPSIDFTRDAQSAVSKVKSGEFDLVLFLRPTSLNEMLLASKKGLKMPQKSTYFYPKLLSGLVFHSLEGSGR